MTGAGWAGRISVPERPAMWLGHYSTLLMLAAVVATVADDATGQRQAAVGWAAAAAWACWIAAFLADGGYHRERLCERCIAASPLDPQAAVDRWRSVLRLHHARAAMVITMGTVVAWNFASVLIRRPPWWVLALSALAYVVLGASYAVAWQHRRLYPWCPFCRWDEGGAHEVSPDVPAPAATRLPRERSRTPRLRRHDTGRRRGVRVRGTSRNTAGCRAPDRAVKCFRRRPLDAGSLESAEGS